MDQERILQIWEALKDDMTEREKQMMIVRFGLEGGEPHTLEETVELTGMTREQLRRLEHRIIRRLSYRNRREKIREFCK